MFVGNHNKHLCMVGPEDIKTHRGPVDCHDLLRLKYAQAKCAL